MATIDQSLATSATGPERAAAPPPEADGRPRRRGFVFWIARYLPAEVAGTAAMVCCGLLASVWTTATPLIALAALVGEIVGFYAVLAVTIYVEQVPVTATRRRASGAPARCWSPSSAQPRCSTPSWFVPQRSCSASGWSPTPSGG